MNAHARRAARCAFGIVLSAGGIVLFWRAWTGKLHDIHALELLATTWPAALGAGVLAWLAARVWPRPIALAPSLALPWIGLALVAPLSISYVVAFALGDGGNGFDDWAQLACQLAIVPHVGLALLMSWRVRELAAGRVPHKYSPLSTSAIYGIVTGLGALPFVFPSVIVGAIGVPLIPLALYTNHIAARERAFDALPAARVR